MQLYKSDQFKKQNNNELQKKYSALLNLENRIENRERQHY